LLQQHGDDAFYNVIRSIDPACEFATETMFSRVIFDGLSRGLREWKWQQRSKLGQQQEPLSGLCDIF